MNKARAYTNIALIKYWGKRNQKWNLPTTSSIGLTLDGFYTETEVKLIPELNKDLFFLEGLKKENKRVNKIMDYFRKLAGKKIFAIIKSKNFVPISNGLASSSSAFAALAKAASKAFKLDLNKQEVSKIARLGSGSASRSIFGGFSIWHRGKNHRNSFAEEILNPVNFDINIIDIIFNINPKKISSTEGMEKAQTSKNYPKWVKQTKKQTVNMIEAIAEGNIKKIGLIAQNNSLAMHRLNKTSIKPFDYFTKKTYKIIKKVNILQKKGLPIFATVDAGPNVKIITNSQTRKIVMQEFKNYGQIITSKPGPGVKDV